MNDASLAPGSDAARARKIRFVAELPARATATETFPHPSRRYAVAETVPVDALLGTSRATEPPDDELRLILLLSGSAGALDFQRRAEQWIHGTGPATVQPIVDLQLRSERILWRAGYAVIIGGAERCDEILPGLVHFAFYEGELRKLERELDADWLTAEADIPLTHSVDRSALARRDHVDAMTRQTALRRVRFARLSPCLFKPSPALAGSARRLAGELAVQAEVVERLGYVDDRLEVYEDLYESANDRLSEFSYYSSEFRLELWIVLLLLAELVVMAVDLWVSWRSMGR
jgi:hypothetical protein